MKQKKSIIQKQCQNMLLTLISVLIVLTLSWSVDVDSIQAEGEQENVSAISNEEPQVTCEIGNLCVIYRRFSINTAVNREDTKESGSKGNMLWTASLRFEGGSLAKGEGPSSRVVTNKEKFIVFKLPLADKQFLVNQEVTLDVYGGGYDVRDVIEGRKFKMPVFTNSGAKIFIQENDNGVYDTFGDMNKVKPLKSIYFERFGNAEMETDGFTNQVIFSTYRSQRTSEPNHGTGYINGEEIADIVIRADGKVVKSPEKNKVFPLGYSHYRIVLPFTIKADDFKKHYTVEIITKEGNKYFAGPSQSRGNVTKADLAQDYASGIHFYDLFRMERFKSTFESQAELGYLGNGKFAVWAPFATRVVLKINGEVQQVAEKADKAVYVFQVSTPKEDATYTFDVTNYGVTHTNVIDPYAYVTGKNGEKAYAVSATSASINGEKQPSYVGIPRQDAIIYEAHLVDVTHQEQGNSKNNTYTSFGVSEVLKKARETGFNFVHMLPIQENKRKDDGFVSGTNYTWGYGPQNLFAVEGSYATNQEDNSSGATGRVKEVKNMISQLHNDKMGVILDVGFNHIYNTYESNFQKLVPDYYYRQVRATAPEQEYTFKYKPALQPANLEPLYEGKIAKSNPSANEFASERTMAAKIVLDATTYFTKQYGVDGFRFDLMGVLPYTLMNQIEEQLRKINPNIIIYGEGWGGKTRLNNGVTDQQNFPPQINPEDVKNGHKWEYTAQSTGRLAVAENIVAMPNVAVFSDKFRNSVIGKVAPSNQDDLGFVETSSYNQFRMDHLRYAMSGGAMIGLLSEYQPNVTSPQQYVNFLDVHDDYTLRDHLSTKEGTRGRYDAKFIRDFSENQKFDRQKMALSMLFLSQGTPILQAGSEFNRTKKNDDVSEFYYDKKDVTLKDVTIDSSKLSDPTSKESQLRDFTQALLTLRKSDERFRLKTVDQVKRLMSFNSVESANAFAIDYKSDTSSKVYKAMYNTSGVDQTFTLDTSFAWKVYKAPNKNVYLSTGTAAQYNEKNELASSVVLKSGEMLVLEGNVAPVLSAEMKRISTVSTNDKNFVKADILLQGNGQPIQSNQVKVAVVDMSTQKIINTDVNQYYNPKTGILEVSLDNTNFLAGHSYTYEITVNNKKVNVKSEGVSVSPATLEMLKSTSFSRLKWVQGRVVRMYNYTYETTTYTYLNGTLNVSKKARVEEKQ